MIPTSVKITYGLTIKTKDGTTIVFNVYEPNSNAVNKPAVIIGHGIMDSKEWMKGYAIEFATSGFVVATLDFRGHGQSGSELDFSQLINDVKAIKTYLDSRSDVNISKLGYLGFSMGGWPGNIIVKNDNSFKCFIGIGTFLNITKNDLGTNRTLNILMAQAKFDEVFSLKETTESISKLLNKSPSEIVPNRLYGSFKDGNASILFFDDNSDHVFLAWDQDPIRISRDWLLNTFPDVIPIDTNFYVNIRAFFLLIQIIGGIIFFYLITDVISNFFIKVKENDIKKVEIENKSGLNLFIKLFIYSFLAGIPSMLLMIPILIFLPLPIAGATAMFLFGVIFAIIILFWRPTKKINLNFWKIFKTPFSISKKILLKHITIGIISSIILFTILYISVGLNLYGIVPSVSKYPWFPIYFSFNLFAFIILNIFFNSILQPKFNNDSFKGLLKVFLIYFTYLMIFLSFIIITLCFIAGNNFLMMVLVIGPPYLLLIAFNSVFLFKKTGNILSSAIINSFFVTCIVCAFSPYMNPLYLLPILLL